MSTTASKKLDSHAAIKPEKNEFADDFLDHVGNEFKFDHAKGLAEWTQLRRCLLTTAKVKDSSSTSCCAQAGQSQEGIDSRHRLRGNDEAGHRQGAEGGASRPPRRGPTSTSGTARRQVLHAPDVRDEVHHFRGGLLNVFGFDEKRRYGYASA